VTSGPFDRRFSHRVACATVAVGTLLLSGCGWVQSGSDDVGTDVDATVAPTQAGDAGEDDAAIAGAQTMTLYTCVTDATVQAVIDEFTEQHPGTAIDLFRAPTGQLNARIAADLRGAGLGADVLWACDPLSMQSYLDQGVARSWVPDNADAIPAEYRTDDYVGVDLLYIVTAVHDGVPAPQTWSDLTGPEYTDRLAIPDPGFAASALGLLGYFESAPDYGLDFYQALADNGAVELDSPTDVLTGVAQGTYDVGVVLANAAYLAQEDGSPIEVVWPEPGAVAVYAPIAGTTKEGAEPLAEAFIEYVASEQGQRTMAATNVYPVLDGIPGPPIPDDASVISPDWSALSGGTDDLLARYRQIFG
jgi:iron(III) transport system substrate-binding protein